ncbi:MAG: glycosyltransferase [Phycisphaerae bacterium]
MIVLNEVLRDARVLRAARSLHDLCDLQVIGVDRRKSPLDESRARRELGLNIQWAPMAKTSRLPRNKLGYTARFAEVFCRALRLAGRHRPHVVHAHDLDTLPIALIMQAMFRSRIVYDAHELYRDTLWSGFRVMGINFSNLLEDYGMSRASAIIACNRYRAKIMQEEYGAPVEPVVISNIPQAGEPVESDILQRYVKQRNPGIRKVVLHQGGICAGRNIETVVASLPHLPTDTAIVLLGGGGDDYVDSLFRQAEELGVRDRLFQHPPVNHDILLPMTCSADVGIVIYGKTPRNNYYCAPNKLNEYAAARLPFVGADLPPIRDFIETWGVGEIFDPDDPRDLAEAIRKVLADENSLKSYRANCDRAARECTWEKEADKLRALYHHLGERIPR